jgi:polysaccharide export outer membrane protein
MVSKRSDRDAQAFCRRLLLSFLLFAVPTAAGCRPPPPQYDYDAEKPEEEAFTVGTGDVLEVRVWRNDALSRRVTVRPDGFITLPLVGDIQAGGRTASVIGRDIMQAAAKFYTEPQVVAVEVAELHSYRVYVLGEVGKPGEFSPKAPVSVLQAIALAGGFTKFASPDRILVIRKDARGERRIPFVYGAVIGEGDLKENLVLQPNDTLVVP